MSEPKTYIFSSQAIYQTEFWFKIALELKKEKKNTKILCFDQESHNFLSLEGFDHQFLKPDYNMNIKEIDEILIKNKIKNLDDILRHEIIYFGNRNYTKIKSKFCSYIKNLDIFFKNIDEKNTIIFQELSGFCSSLSIFNLARKYSINNFFIEPSFFQGRFHLTKNTFMCDPISNKNSVKNFESIFDNIKMKKKIVIPKKDISHFKSPTSKIFNSKNIMRFINKFIRIYIFKQSYEFDEVIKYSILHLKNFLNYVFLLPIYERSIPKDNFLYFPLHVPNDFAITIRSPKYIDQLKLIKKILKELPPDQYLFIKEHPARVGSINFSEMYKLLKNKKIKILKPSINSYDIIEKSRSIITINSKTGFEALIYNKPLYVFGESYYKNQNFINYLDESFILDNHNLYPKTEDTKNFFLDLYKKTFKGDIYDCNNKNIKIFAASIMQYDK